MAAETEAERKHREIIERLEELLQETQELSRDASALKQATIQRLTEVAEELRQLRKEKHGG